MPSSEGSQLGVSDNQPCKVVVTQNDNHASKGIQPHGAPIAVWYFMEARTNHISAGS